ncbi:uncharacterized protein PHALS_04664 [Plasmopara halstedii]|uniref:Uncharacterized protein n=1 Tax=Plasmopara halstedii TaxID=4781 RepID=A0A0P1AA50_PLAHL|nr:uncharacterized protein PHALS_04664 [Plasmopara halstedii]CEG37220.1 hypothetical protein PHALS_04664 [Plasmopara halstedii]|eukprot:XP_024573589.1 hypothetical protein PHALS_04664 [Plasmopara halstedii]
MSDSASAAPGDGHPRLDEQQRRALRKLSMTNDLGEDVEAVDYESDTPFFAWDDEEGELRQQRNTSPARALRTPCPFLDFSSAEERGVITNDVDGTQRRQLKAAHKAAPKRAHPRPVIDFRVEYGFRPVDPAVEAKDAVTRSLRVHIIGPPARTEYELAKRKALRARNWFQTNFRWKLITLV